MIKPVIFSFLSLLAINEISAQVISAQSGNWNSKSTWVGNVVPGNGDSVSISDGNTVTVTDSITIGASNGSLAVFLNNSGSLVIDSGGVLRVRGNVSYTAGSANTANVITVNAGGTWLWDASRSASPLHTHYKFYPNGSFGYRSVVASGNSSHSAVLTSETSGGNGCFVMNGEAYGNPFQFSYAAISNIGTDSLNSFEFWYYSPGGGIHPVVYDVTHTVFMSCGQIFQQFSSDSNGTFRHDYNIHLNSLGSNVMSVDYTGTVGKGLREIVGNMMDVTPFHYYSALGGFTITNNYFGGDCIGGLNDQWVSFNNNFSKIEDPVGALVVPSGNTSNCYFMIDMDMPNPHVVFPTQWPSTHTGNIFSQSGSSTGDSGEMFLDSYIISPTEFDVLKCIFLTDMYGYSPGEMTSMGGSPYPLPVFEHNTWFGGHSDDYPGFGGMDYSETGNVYPGQIHSLRSNIFWNPQLPATPVHFLKMLEIDNEQGTANAGGGYDPGGGPTLDPVGNTADPTSGVYSPDVSKADYNAGWGFSDTTNQPNHAAYHNQGKGYVGNWTSTPGVHDVNANPQFFDWQRDVVLFDNDYLQNTAPAWSGSSSYSVGEMVSTSNPVAYWGKTVNFRYTNGPGCLSSNPKPLSGSEPKGDSTTWRQCWEFASLYRLREGVTTHQLFTDTSIGASNDDIILTLIKWVRRGYTPTNNAYRGAAHDGTDIGAVTMRPLTDAVLNQKPLDNSLMVYPNPGTGTFELKIKSNKIVLPYTVDIYNSMGQLVFSQLYNLWQTTIMLDNPAAGVYFLHLREPNSQYVSKLVVE